MCKFFKYINYVNFQKTILSTTNNQNVVYVFFFKKPVSYLSKQYLFVFVGQCHLPLMVSSFESIFYLSLLMSLASICMLKDCGVVVILAANTVKMRLRLIIINPLTLEDFSTKPFKKFVYSYTNLS